MTKIVCFEGSHGSGKGALIGALQKKLSECYSGHFDVLRDSEYPEFEEVKRDIREGRIREREEIILTVARTRAQVYRKYIFDAISKLDLALLDRSYYTSAVWQADSCESLEAVLQANENEGVPMANLAFMLFARPQVIISRLTSRNRQDISEHSLAMTLRDQERFLYLAQHRKECIAFNTEDSPLILAERAYSLISANNAL